MNAVPHLVIIGGAEDKTGPKEILREFVRRAGGATARVVVLPTASELADTGPRYAELFRALGAADVDVIEVATREQAHAPELERLVAEATALFLTGGDQLRLMNRIGGTPIDMAMHRRVEEGMLVGGTSAGAAVMSGTMIVEGETYRVQADAVRTGPGFELLPGVIIDQHFAQRGRIGRLLAVVAQHPHYLGVGIDEDTALIVEGHAAHVIGRGAVTIVDAGSTTYNDAADVPASSAMTLAGVTLHSIPHGRSFDLFARRLVVAGA